MFNLKKRDRSFSEQMSPPHKMAKSNKQTSSQPTNSDLMAQLTQLVASNVDVMRKIEQLERRFKAVEKIFEEVEILKREVARLSKQSEPINDFRKFEVEQKRKSILVKGLESLTKSKYESRQETYDRVSEMFDHIGLETLTVEDYQRLGPINPNETGSTLVRLKFWSKDDRAQLFAKFKELRDDPILKRISLINDYPTFQLAEVKKLSDEAYRLRKKDKSTKTRIVPKGLDVQLQMRKGQSEKWTTVNSFGEQNKA
jgi:hypothetical protein